MTASGEERTSTPQRGFTSPSQALSIPSLSDSDVSCSRAYMNGAADGRLRIVSCSAVKVSKDVSIRLRPVSAQEDVPVGKQRQSPVTPYTCIRLRHIASKSIMELQGRRALEAEAQWKTGLWVRTARGEDFSICRRHSHRDRTYLNYGVGARGSVLPEDGRVNEDST